uniref:Secreted protein n=1 Tax=Peronospora matthiolae TaxID=2874970 RepID=A0AAV1T4F6_9STRA
MVYDQACHDMTGLLVGLSVRLLLDCSTDWNAESAAYTIFSKRFEKRQLSCKRALSCVTSVHNACGIKFAKCSSTKYLTLFVLLSVRLFFACEVCHQRKKRDR